MLLRDWAFLNLPARKYSELKEKQILKTLDSLTRRVAERFPDSGLSAVVSELSQVAREIEDLLGKLRGPIWELRVLTISAILALVGLAIWVVVMTMQLSPGVNGIADVLQAAESAINELIFLSLAIYFLASLETRFKRWMTLRSLHRLRSIAHVVDMHQLTKDPAYLLGHLPPTISSPQRTMTSYQLTRYLDYCSEMLALLSKLAALHAQYVEDHVVLTAVNDVESLAQGLSNKIWQKIMILDLASEQEDQARIEKIKAEVSKG